MEKEWRKFITKQIKLLFDHVGNSLYDMDHALNVEKAVIDIIHSDKKLGTNFGLPVISSAALLHDIGFTQQNPKWSLDAFEHVRSSKEIASQILSMAPLFKDNPVLIDQVLFLIEHHDDTTYSFPTITNRGRPLIRKNQISKSTELMLLQEADSQIHASACLEKTLQYWERNGLSPCLSQNKRVIPGWQWHESIFSNVRLLSKRSILDSFTTIGQQRSLEIYDALEEYLKRLCSVNNVSYLAEACHPKLRQESIQRLASKQHDLDIIAFLGWNDMISIIRGITLHYDKSIHPYENAHIESQLVPLGIITPMALYVMKTRLEETLEFHDALMVNFCMSLWDLPGILEFRYNSEEYQKIAPPIIEEYEETSKPEHPKLMGLLDGLHRSTVAREIGQENVFAIVASYVPYPPEPLPVKWEQIKKCRNKPRNKKLYRYSDWQTVPKEIKDQFSTMSEENFSRFFYRDLKPLGSKGMRGFDEFHKKQI